MMGFGKMRNWYACNRKSLSCDVLLSCCSDQSDRYDPYGGRAENRDRYNESTGIRNFSIASKYMGYAFLATITGSILGVLVGEKILPYIIIYAYGILYQHIPKIYGAISMSYTVYGIGSFNRVYLESNNFSLL